MLLTHVQFLEALRPEVSPGCAGTKSEHSIVDNISAAYYMGADSPMALIPLQVPHLYLLVFLCCQPWDTMHQLPTSILG